MSPLLQRLAALLLAAGSVLSSGCEGKAGGFTHAVAPSQVTSDVTFALGDGDAITDRSVEATRLQQCRGGLVGLSIGSGVRGKKGQPKLTTLYLKAPTPIARGTYPVQFRGGRWTSTWALDGTITPDPSRSIAPFGMEPEGTVDGVVTIERSDVDSDGTRHLAGTLTAKVAGDGVHRVSLNARFAVAYPKTDGCP